MAFIAARAFCSMSRARVFSSGVNSLAITRLLSVAPATKKAPAKRCLLQIRSVNTRSRRPKSRYAQRYTKAARSAGFFHARKLLRHRRLAGAPDHIAHPPYQQFDRQAVD